MNIEDADRFRQILLGIGRMYGQDLDNLVLDAYWLALKDWSYEEFSEAAAHLMAHSRFMPRPFDFNQLKTAGEQTPGEAWAEALEACVDWRTPEELPEGRVARAAAAVGGFRAIAMADTEHGLPHLERRFKEAYADLTEVDPVREALPVLTDAVRIGERKPALRVGSDFKRLGEKS